MGVGRVVGAEDATAGGCADAVAVAGWVVGSLIVKPRAWMPAESRVMLAERSLISMSLTSTPVEGETRTPSMEISPTPPKMGELSAWANLVFLSMRTIV